MNCGAPYQGSKNGIAKWVIDHLPKAEVFVDVFAGGCAVTHAAMLSGKYKRFIVNDITDVPKLFYDAVNGKYRDEKRWISRADFFRLKDKDPYVRYCWSFGNDGKMYMYGKEVELWKKALHYARVLGDNSLLCEFGIDSDGSSADIRKHINEYKRNYIEWYVREVMKSDIETETLRQNLTENIKRNSEELRQYLIDGLKRSGRKASEVDRFLGTNGMAGHYFGRSQWQFPTRDVYIKLQTFIDLPQSYEEIYGLQELLQSLQSLQSLQRLEVYQLDYRELQIPDNAVIYCDPPYKGTQGYLHDFDHNAFYDWCRNLNRPVYISEYSMPDDFTKIDSIKKRVLLAQDNKKVADECLFGYNVEKRYKEPQQLTLWNI